MIASDDRSDIAVTPSGADARLAERPRSRAIVPAGRSAAVLPMPDRAVRPWQPASGTRRRPSTWRGGSQSASRPIGPRLRLPEAPPSWRAAPRALAPSDGFRPPRLPRSSRVAAPPLVSDSARCRARAPAPAPSRGSRASAPSSPRRAAPAATRARPRARRGRPSVDWSGSGRGRSRAVAPISDLSGFRSRASSRPASPCPGCRSPPSSRRAGSSGRPPCASPCSPSAMSMIHSLTLT